MSNETTENQSDGAPVSSVETVNSKAQKRLVLPKPGQSDIQVPEAPGGSGLSVPSADAAPAAAQPAAPRATVSAAGPADQGAKKLQFRSPAADDVPVVEAPQLVVSADGNVQDDDEIEIVDEHTKEINVAFMNARGDGEGEEKPKMDRKSLIMLCVAGAIAAVVLLLMAVLGFMMILDSMRPPPEPPPKPLPVVDNGGKKPPVVGTEDDDDDDDDDDDAPPVPVEEQRALVLAGDLEQEILQGSLLGGTKSGFTIEFWFTAGETSGKLDKIKSITVTNSGAQEQFMLKCGRDRKGTPIALFRVERASDKYVKADLPDGRGWIHVAAVYDPSGDGYLRLFIQGRLQAERKCTNAPRLLAVGYKLKVSVDEGATVLLDEFRFCEAAMYKKDFSPAQKGRLLEVEESTRSLLRFNTHEDGKIIDAGQDDKEIAFSADNFRKIDIDSFEMALPARLECPLALLRAMERKYGKKDADKFRKDWPTFTDGQKLRLRKKFEQSGGNL